MKEEPIDNSSYTEDYFLKHCSGWNEWIAGQRDAGRFKFMFDLANIKPGDKVLDLGCGRGESSYLAAKAGGIVTMIDFAPSAIELAKITMKDFPETKFICCDLKDFPVDKYDHIFCLEVFEHLWDWELEKVISKMKECGGTLWLYTSPEKNWGIKNLGPGMGDRLRHINCHTEESLKKLLIGWKIEFIPYGEMHLSLKATYEI